MLNKLLGWTLIGCLLILPIMVSCGQKQENEKTGGDTQSQSTTTLSDAAAQNQSGAAATTENGVPAKPPELAGVEKQLVDKLFSQWDQKGNLASVDQVAKMLGNTVTDSVRADLLRKFETNTGFQERMNRYRPYTYILSNEEKLIALYIIKFEKAQSQFPTLKQIAAGTNLSEKEVAGRLKFLSKVEFLFDLGGTDEFNKLGFSYGAKQSEYLYDMGLRYHVFHVEDQSPFNIGCAKEAFFMIASEYTKSKVRYTTIDLESLEPVEITFENAQITSVSPDSIVYLEGGPCGSNNLFTSRDKANIWQQTIPQLRNQQPVAQNVYVKLDEAIKQAAAKAAEGK